MATTTRNKHRQMLKEMEEGESLAQEVEKGSETDSDYDDETDVLSEKSCVTIQENTISDMSDIIIIDDTETNIQTSSKKKRKPPTKVTKPKTSWVWKFFKFNENNTKVICQISGCERMLTWCGSPSSLSTHLSGTHNITKEIAIKNNAEELKNPSIPAIKPHHPLKQESLTKNVMGFVIGTVQPLSIIEDPDFINMVNGFDQRYKVPCTKTLKDRISKTYEVGKVVLKNQFSQVQYISLTLDAWSSPAHLPYLGVTAHWVTSKFELHEVLLSMDELPYPHTAAEIQNHLLDLLNEWEIDSKISAIITDNASNVKKACNNMGIGERIPCAAHMLQLSIGKGLDVVKPLIDKCKHLITFLAADKKKQQLKESQVYLHRQQAMQVTEGLENEIENIICLDVIKANNTRWNSTLYAFQRLIILKPAISMLKATLMSDSSSNVRKEGEKLEELYPTIYEWKVIKEMVELLSPFEIATRFLSGVKYPTIGFTYPSMYNLKERLETDFTSLETSDAEECKNTLLDDLIARWEFPQDLCLKGSFFDPRFKSLDFIKSQEKIDDIINQLKAEFEIIKQNDTSLVMYDNDIDDLTTAMGNFWKKKNAKIVAPVKNEFQHYLNVLELPALEEYDPYIWWLTNKKQYPLLHKLAIKYLSIPATSVPSERLFSDAKNLVTPQRTRLDSNLINQMMFLKRNREYVDIYGEAE
jgi:hypothetical protein